MVNLPVTDNDNLKRLNSIFESGKVTLSYKTVAPPPQLAVVMKATKCSLQR